MEEKSAICTYSKDEMRCERPAQPGTDRCDKHPHEGGLPASTAPVPPPKTPPSAIDTVKNLITIERLIELGRDAWEWIKENIPPDIFGASSEAQLSLLQQMVQEQNPALKRQLALRLVPSLSHAQLLLLLALIVAASSVRGAGADGAAGSGKDT